MKTLVQDLRYTLRSLRKSPGFAAVVVLTLAFTLGANSTMFGLIDAVLLRPLPFAEPERLVALWDSRPEKGELKWRVAGGNFLRWKEQNEVFDKMALFAYDTATLTGLEDPARLFGSRVTEDFFPLLGVEPLHGRTLLADDYAADAPDVIVLSHALWSRHFGADPGLVGRAVSLEGRVLTVVGVLRKQIMPLVAQHSGVLRMNSQEAFFWTPLKQVSDRPSHVFGVLGRLRPGVSLETADAQMQTIARRLETETPDFNQGFGVTLVPLLGEAVGDVKTALWLLLGAVGFVLVIACANVANLLLVRGAEREKEFAVRSVLGAGRWRIWRQVMSEGIVLAVGGALLGTVLAHWGLRLLPTLVASEIPRLDEAGLDVRIFGVTLALCVTAGLLCSLVPAVKAGRHDLETALRAGGRGQRSGSPRLRQALVTAEMALAVVLVVGSGLLLRSFGRLQGVDPGFERGEILTFRLLLHPDNYTEMERLNTFLEDFSAELQAIPGVTSVGAAYDHPLAANWTQGFRIEDAPAPEPGQGLTGYFRTVTPEYFETLGIEVLEGRGFTAGDRADAPGSVVVNQAFVRRYFPDRPALGQKLRIFTTQWRWGEDAIPISFEIVGLVEDVHFTGLAAETEPAFYLPYRQTPHETLTFCIRSAVTARSLLPEVRRRLAAIDPNLPLGQVSTFDELLSGEVAKPRFNAGTLSAFAAGSLLLAMIGLWGVLSHAVRQRVQEIGVRMALGASRASVFRVMMRHGLRPAVLGLGIGMAGAFALSRWLEGLLFEISPTDGATYGAVSALLLGVAFLACAIPADRAARTDPMTVLRDE